MKLKIVRTIALSALIILVALLGCVGGGGGGAAPTPSPSPTVSPSPSPSPTPSKVTIVIWHAVQESERQVFENLISQFEATHPNIDIVFEQKADLETTLKAAIPAGQGPDLFIWAHDWIGKFAEGNMLKPIDKYITEDILNKFVDIARNAIEYKGHYYGMPISGETVTLIYNKDLISNPPKTFDELVQMAKQFYNPNSDMYGLASPIDPYFLSAWAHAFGGYYFNDTTKTSGLDQPETIKGYELFFNELFFKYMAQTRDYNSQMALFLEGKSPLLINGPWSIKQIRDSGINFGLTLIPKIVENGKEYYPRPYAGVKMFYVTANAPDDKMDAIWEFLSWMTLNESTIKTLALQLGYIPVLKSLIDDPDIKSDPVIYGFMNQLRYAILMPKSPEMGSVWGPIDTAITKIVSGEMSIEDALKEAQQKILQELGSS
ncbi:MAG: extracellular solute-binding protein [Euryarchaeota archaeon]|nr:extracellular solute-binding protein [Euryarchaeota archaeon]